jgi:uncharacterized protein YciI
MRRLLASALLLLALSGVAIAAEPDEKWEMTTYQVAFLKRGPNWTPGETPETKAIQEGHMANIRKMGATGKLVIAGPFADDGDLRGLFIFRVDTLEEAKALAEQDPAVKAGRLVLEWHPWYAAKNIVVTPKAAAPPR